MRSRLLAMRSRRSLDPYKRDVDNYMAMTCSLLLIILFLCCIIYRFADLSNLAEIRAIMSIDQVSRHSRYQSRF